MRHAQAATRVDTAPARPVSFPAVSLRFFRRTWFAALAACAPLLSLPQGTAVLCVTSDGRIAVEMAASEPAPAVHGDAGGAIAPGAGACPCGQECGPCNDAPLGSGGPELRPSRIQTHPAPGSTVAVAGVVRGLVSPRVTRDRLPGDPAARSFRGPGRSTVVLLI